MRVPCSSMLMSNAKTIFSAPYFSIQLLTNCGCLTAVEPTTTRCAPASSRSTTSCSLRTPPPI
ncbi:Uncharacterised protein [Vibrio cholerae]|nr:Uncharacterised protein [Vibrio cholerae]